VSQEQALLKLLADGTWWSTAELLNEVPCVVHSRIAGLRDKGFNIIHERTGPGAKGSRYRLVRALATEEDAGCGTGTSFVASVPSTPSQADDDTGGALDIPGQLDLLKGVAA
jgi:hypothetical protein